MQDRTTLLRTWLEREDERHRRPVLPPPQARDLALRGWVQVGVCALVGSLAAGIFVCWLAREWGQATRVAFTEELRGEALLRAAGDPDPLAERPTGWTGRRITARRNDGALETFLCVLVFAIPAGIVIGSVFLRAACALYNQLAGGKGSPASVPELLFGRAMGITGVTTLVNAVAGYVIGSLVGAGNAAAGAGERGPAVLAQLLSLPVSLLVMAGMNSALLPTTFSRGLLVALCYLLVVLFAAAVLTALFGGLFLVVSLLR